MPIDRPELNREFQYAIDDVFADIRRGLIRGRFQVGNMSVLVPPPSIKADLSITCFDLVLGSESEVTEAATKLSSNFDLSTARYLDDVSATGVFINFRLRRTLFASRVLEDHAILGDQYGTSNQGLGEKVIIDMSSPNIAKPMSVAHLRSTIIGQSILNLLSFSGFDCLSDNHIGDWGTQFGRLLYALEEWGDVGKLELDPIAELLRVYVEFHDRLKSNKDLELVGREYFRRLESGDESLYSRWRKIADLSMNEFKRIYRLLGIDFDLELGESYYSKMIPTIYAEAMNLDETVVNQDGSMVIDLRKENIITPLLIRKSDGSSLYATRDLATIKYRIEKLGASIIIYVVGSDQRFYFQQLFAAAKLFGYEARLIHVPFGLVSLPKGKMSTRAGNLIYLEDVISEAKSRARDILHEKNPMRDEYEQSDTARMVGIGAVKFSDLCQDRERNIVFDWKRALSMDGFSGPYIQYTNSRCRSILSKSNDYRWDGAVPENLVQSEFAVILSLSYFPHEVLRANSEFAPHIIATYLYDLATKFNAFYHQVSVLDADTMEQVGFRLAVVRMTSAVIVRGMSLLGIECPDRM